MNDDEFGSAEDSRMDARLRRMGEELRAGASAIEGSAVLIGSLKQQLARARRMTGLVTAVALLVTVGLLAALTVLLASHKGSDDRVDRVGEPASVAVRLVDSLPPEPVDPHKVKLVAAVSRYDSCGRLVDVLHRVGAEHVGSHGFGNLGSVMPYFDSAPTPFAAADEFYVEKAFAGGDGAGVPVSSDLVISDDPSAGTLGTNVVVEGVDEPDTVKATANLVIDIWGTKLRVADTTTRTIRSTLELTPAGQVGEAFQIDALPAEEGGERIHSYPSSLLVSGDRVLVFGVETVPAPPLPDDPSAARPPHNYLTVTFVDLSDPDSPVLENRVRIEGYLVAARRVGDKVRLVTASSLAELPMVLPTSPESVAAALRQNRLAVAESTVADWIPDWDHGEHSTAAPLVACDKVIVPDTFAGVDMTSLVQFDMSGPFRPQAMAILAPSENMSANAGDAVVMSHVWVDPARQKDDFSDWRTALHRFTFGVEGPTYVGSGAVPGSVRDEFSLALLDESTIGVVTVDVVPWSTRGKEKVTVRLLRNRSERHELTQVSELQPRGSGAGIGAVRFLGDRLLVSSGPFQNSLSVIDLSDHTTPRDLGSADLGAQGDYVHPLGDNRIMVLASSLATVDGNPTTGVRVLLVDIAGPPRVVATWDQPSANTQAAYDHHAFTWWPERSLAAFEIQRYRRTMQSDPTEAAFIRVDGDALIERLVQPTDVDLGRPKCRGNEMDWSRCDSSGPPYVQRVLVVNGTIWLYTSESLEALDPGSLASTGVIVLPPPG